MDFELTGGEAELRQTKKTEEKVEPARPSNVQKAVEEVRRLRKELAAAIKVVRELGDKGRRSPVRQRKNKIKAKQRQATKMIEAQRKAEAKRISAEKKAEAKRIAAAEKPKRPTITKARIRVLQKWVADPSNYEEECRLRDEAANLHTHPID